MIIDCHVHIGKTEKTRYFYTYRTYAELMQENGVGAAVVFPNVSSVIQDSKLNEKFLQEFEGEELYPFLLVDPGDPLTLEQVKKHDIYGVKFHPSITRFTADSKELVPFWECCLEKNINAIIHCGSDPVSSVCYLISAAKRFQAVNFIAAHLGGGVTHIIEKSLELVKEERLDNVYLETSAVNFPDLVGRAVESVGCDKVLFGSDVPFMDFRIGKITVELADISDRDKEAIFSGNACSLFGLDWYGRRK